MLHPLTRLIAGFSFTRIEMESRPTTGINAAQVQALIAASGYTTVPATSTSTGNPGQYSANASYFYICVAPNSWRRVLTEAF